MLFPDMLERVRWALQTRAPSLIGAPIPARRTRPSPANMQEIEVIQRPGEGDAGDDELVIDIGNNYHLSIEVSADEMRVRLRDASDDEMLYRDDWQRDWFESEQKRKKYGNQMADAADRDDLNSGWLKTKLRELALTMKDDETTEMTPDAKKLVEELTSDVKAYQSADGLTVMVWVDSPASSPIDDTRIFRFDLSEWRSDSAETVKAKYYQNFLVEPEIGDQDWNAIWEDWNAQKTVATTEQATEEDIIADRVTDRVAQRCSTAVTRDREQFVSRHWGALYEDADESRFDTETVWVKSEAIEEVVEEQTDKSGTGYHGKLSGALQRNDHTIDSTKRVTVDGEQIHCYPFNPEALNIDETDLMGGDDEANETSADGRVIDA